MNITYSKRNIFIFGTFALLTSLSIGCENDPIVSDPIENKQHPNFSFYPTENALWIEKSSQNTPKGTIYYYDTFYLRKDTFMETRTMDPTSSYYADADSPSLKRYQEIAVRTMEINHDGDTIYRLNRHGWFRQDISKKKIYTPDLGPAWENVYESLALNFNVKKGDTLEFFPSTSGTIVVKAIDSIRFNNQFLKQISYGKASNEYITGKYTQAWDLVAESLFVTYDHFTDRKFWKKFIFGSDTMTVNY